MRDVEVIAEPDAAAVALDPVRARLLAELREPASAATLAARVGLSRQKVNYHLNKLQAHGLVEEVEQRRWGGLTERRLVASAAAYVVSPDAMGQAASDPARLRDRLSAAYVIALAARVVREVGGMARNAVREGKRLPVLGLDTDIRFASPADRAAFAEELTAAVTALVGKYHDEQAPDGRWQRLVLTIHPVPKDVDPSPPTERAPAAAPSHEQRNRHEQ
jgi:DNA-binding transcriptional ArsR family regulator